MESWKQSLILHFEKGTKRDDLQLLGVEIEHFILDCENRAVPYGGKKGVREILSQLMELYPDAQILPDDDFFGFQTKMFAITIEPAAQLEISIAPLQKLRRIEKVYRAFSRNLDTVLSRFDYKAVRVGCQPESKVSELEIIPKRRYALMNERFGSFGTGGMEMMRGTASLQVSIDYTSETDFRKKLQAAYFFGPIFKLFCDNTPSFQGKPVTTHLKRTDIWRRSDPVRCGILPDVFSDGYGFSDYADYLGNLPPIFIKEAQRLIPTGTLSAAQIYAGRTLSEEDIAHIISMAFPDVRLKQFLELRFADAVPLPFAMAYCALIKGLLYSESGLSFAQRQIREKALAPSSIMQAEDSIMENGWNGVAYGIPVRILAQEMLKEAKRNLPTDEQEYLSPFYTVVQYEGICNIPISVSPTASAENRKETEALK